MQYRQLGNSELSASVVAFGAWAIGGWKWGGTDAKESIDAIHSAVDSGINFIDTAAVYGFGLSEEIVGKAIASHTRDSLIVATKCGLRWDIETPTLHAESDGKRIFRTLDTQSIALELEQSLKRLNTDYIDLYQTHWPDPETTPEEVMSALIEHKRAGKIRAIGFCNATTTDLGMAASTGHLDVDQERYSLLDRERDADNLLVCVQKNLSFLAYSPMAQGLLTDKRNGNRTYNEGDLRIDNPRFSAENLVAIAAVLEPVHALAKQCNVKLEQLVLAWTLQQPGVSHVLVGARNAEQAASNAIAGSLTLSEEELNTISKAANQWRGFS